MSSTTAAERPPIESAIRVEAGSGLCIRGKVHEREEITSTKWLSLHSLTYTLPKDADAKTGGRMRKWDVLSRATRKEGAVADAVVVLALLRLQAGDDPRVVLVKQYRPPIDAVCVELPAGLIDAGETAEAAALRELKEETGFYGRVVSVGGPEALSPGATDEKVVVVRIDVEGQVGDQALEDTEEIDVVSVPVGRLREALSHMEEKEGCTIMHAVASLGLGIDLAYSVGRL